MISSKSGSGSAAAAHIDHGVVARAGTGRIRTRFRKLSGDRWIVGFVIFQFIAQLALLFPQVGTVRVPVRVATFGASLFLLVYLRGRGKQHPATPLALVSLGIVMLSFFNPGTNSFLAGLAHLVFYFAILGPLFWVKRLHVDGTTLRRTILVFWFLNSASAAVGVMQVYFPGRFQPAISSVVAGQGEGYLESLQITTVDGRRVFRPMGLTDVPGGAGGAGMYAVVLGLALFVVDKRLGMKLLLASSISVGVLVIYLSQVRSILVMTACCVLIFGAALARGGKIGRLGMVTGLMSVVSVLSLGWAIMLTGQVVPERLSSLWEESASEVYYENRGIFLERTITELIPEYPFGAGLGRWGMMHLYFGDRTSPAGDALWVEIQWTGWVLDGGVPLVLAYGGAILVTIVVAGRMLLARDRTAGADVLSIWAAVILAYNVGALALTFNYPLFIGQLGLQFWLLNATLFAAAATEHARRKQIIPVDA